jgi:hypothetical protein
VVAARGVVRWDQQVNGVDGEQASEEEVEVHAVILPLPSRWVNVTCVIAYTTSYRSLPAGTGQTLMNIRSPP